MCVSYVFTHTYARIHHAENCHDIDINHSNNLRHSHHEQMIMRNTHYTMNVIQTLHS